MSQNEQLREALLEIEVLRTREQAALYESRALLDILGATTSSKSPKTALNQILGKASEILGADCMIAGHVVENTFRIDASTMAHSHSVCADVDADFFTKSRNIPDLDKLPHLDAFRDLFESRFRSLLIAPTSYVGAQGRAIAAFATDPHKFTKQDLNLLKRLMQITEPALRNLELLSQNTLLAAVIDGSSSGFAIADAKDPELPLVFVNQAFETLTGYGAEEVLGQNCRFLTAEPNDSPERQRLRRVIKNRETGRFLLRNRKKSGEYFWNDLTLFPVYGPDGEVSQIVATQTDATDRVTAEEQTQMARARLQDALDHTKDAYLLILKDGTIGFSNRSTREMFLAGEDNWAVGSEFKANWAQYLSGLPKSVKDLPIEMLNPDLDALCKTTAGIRTGLPDGRQVLFRAEKTSEGATVISATDTTAIRNTERLLRQRAAAVENAIDGIGILDEDGRVVYANSALGQLLGYTSEQLLLGRKWQTRYDTPPNVDQLRAEAGLSENASILRLKTKSNHAQFHEVTRTFVEDIGDVMVVRDISMAVRNRSRLAQLNKQIEDGKRREELSNLAAGLAHDFNNVLSAVSGSATLINTDPQASSDIKSHAQRITKASATAARLINRMLDLGTVDDDASIFDLRSVLGEFRALAEVNLASDTELVIDKGEEPLRIRAAIADIILVLLNLVNNANDAMTSGAGRIIVSLSPFSDADNLVPLMGQIIPERRYAMIRVQDNGDGIPTDVLPKILNSFFTTKGDRGTGAGLAMVAAVVKRLGGAILVQSELQHGTIIDVVLPLIETSVGEEQFADNTADLSNTTILILDDQLDVAGVMATFLEQCGAEASALSDPEAAIEAICEDPDLWTALITDYDMPEMSGGDVIEKIRAVAPNFPIFVVTALARRLSDPRINKKTVQGVFAKPTNLGQLSLAIEKVTQRS